MAAADTLPNFEQKQTKLTKTMKTTAQNFSFQIITVSPLFPSFPSVKK